MPTFLTFTIVILLFIAAGGLFARWWLRRSLRAAFGGDGSPESVIAMFTAMTRQSMHMQLTPAAEGDVPVDPDNFARNEAALQRLGLHPVGRFTCAAAQGAMLSAFVDEHRNVYGIVHSAPIHGIFVEFFSRYPDHDVCIHTTAPVETPDVGEWMATIRLPDADLPELLSRHLADRPPSPLPAEAASFVSLYSGHLQRMLAEVLKIHLPPELRKVLELDAAEFAQPEPADNLFEAPPSMEDAVLEAFAETRGIDPRAIDHARHRLLVVTDETPIPEIIHHLCECGLLSHADDDGRAADLQHAIELGDRRHEVARFVRSHAREQKIEHIGSVTQPVEADIYLAAPMLVGDEPGLVTPP
ncbi:MAG: hypothetical protein KF866_11965 [Phycisphaeraceae bacterium]|nr:hypothetical protein [Phycisphaeraceae bacterium]MCW5755251.1 hypothetical protein [Phycisphaeraceae bacterium]